ncbi:DUF3040 domain-containing protein [Streptacidiphilus sp. PAMC 29251]
MTEPGTRHRLMQIYRSQRREDPALKNSVLYQKSGDWIGVAALLVIAVVACILGGWWIAVGAVGFVAAGLMLAGIVRRHQRQLP